MIVRVEDNSSKMSINSGFYWDLVKLGRSMGNDEIGGFFFASRGGGIVLEDDEDDDISVEGGVTGELVADPDSFLIPRQEVSYGATEFDEEFLAEFYEQYSEMLNSQVLVWWHSHHSMGVTPSVQDNETLEMLGENFLTCMLITNNAGEFVAIMGRKLYGIMMTARFGLDFCGGDTVYNRLPDCTNQTVDEMVTKAEPPVYRYNQAGYNQTGYRYKNKFYGNENGVERTGMLDYDDWDEDSVGDYNAGETQRQLDLIEDVKAGEHDAARVRSENARRRVEARRKKRRFK